MTLLPILPCVIVGLLIHVTFTLNQEESDSSLSVYYNIYRPYPLALLSGTLRTYQKAACDEEWMNLKCPTGTTVSIQLAQYGKVSPSPALCNSPSNNHPELLKLSDPHNNITCLWPQAIQTVVGLCQKKTSCKFQTSSRTFGGDPCPGSRKYVEVAFKCRPSEFKSVIGCEDDVIQLGCNRSSRIAIYSANFGRTEYESILCPQPKGVPEETCLSSYGTETVMQICHGKRKCALGVHSETFGSPCKPESKEYLKVTYTCIPRKVLKEKYQGDPEPDEIFDDDNDEDPSESEVAGVIEQPSIYSPDHFKSQPENNGSRKETVILQHQHTSLNQTSEGSGKDKMISLKSFIQRDIDKGNELEKSIVKVNNDKNHGVEESKRNEDSWRGRRIETRILSIVAIGIQVYDKVLRNPIQFYLYLATSIASGLLMLVILLLFKIWIARYRTRTLSERDSSRATSGVTNCTSSKPSSSSVGPLTSALSDIDELSVVNVMNPSTSSGDLQNSEIQSNLCGDSNQHQPLLSSPRDYTQDPFPNPMPMVGTISGVSYSSCTCTCNPNPNTTTRILSPIRENEVVRFSTESTILGRYPTDETQMINQKCGGTGLTTLNRNSSSNIHFY